MICVDEESLTHTWKQGFNHFLIVSEQHGLIVSLIAVCYLLCA